jgi:hypothetical protein
MIRKNNIHNWLCSVGSYLAAGSRPQFVDDNAFKPIRRSAYVNTNFDLFSSGAHNSLQ